jgi:hypothetical protein
VASDSPRDPLLDRFDRHLARFDELLDANTTALERSSEAFGRNSQAFERNRDAFHRNAEALDRNTRAWGHTVGAMRAVTARLEGMGDEIRANTQAVLQVLDRLQDNGQEAS